MRFPSGSNVGRAPRTCGAAVGLLVLWSGTAAHAQSAAKPAPQVPWAPIESGLTQLANGDGAAALASFHQARSTDDSGLTGTLIDLTEAYVAYHRPAVTGAVAPWLRSEQLLDTANRHFHDRPIPPPVLAEALARVRQVLKQAPATPASGSPALLRPLLCNLRLLSGDRATDGEPVLEGSTKNGSPLTRPLGVFTPQPVYPPEARKGRAHGIVVLGVSVDSEGCPASATVLKPQPPDAMANTTLAILRWYAYEPARYQGTPVSVKFTQTSSFMTQ